MSTPPRSHVTSSGCPTASTPFDAAPLSCAGVATYKAVKVAGTRSSDLVAVFGVGGHVVAIDLHDEKIKLARELCASSP